jgi:hypothetical protein
VRYQANPLSKLVVIFLVVLTSIVWIEKLFSGEIFSQIGKEIAVHGWFWGMVSGFAIIIGIPLFLIMLIKIVTEG